ncbi:hypothetical protein [Clostridium sp.]
MKIPIISKLWEHRAGTKNSFWGSTYSFFFIKIFKLTVNGIMRLYN